MEPMWLSAHCILGKFLGIVCHCFSPSLEAPTFATTCLSFLSDARDPSSERWNYGRERCPVVILPKFRLPRKFRDLVHAANLRHGTDGCGGLEVACWSLVPKFAGSNPAEAVGFLGRKNPQHAFLRRGSKAVGPML